MLFLKYEIYSLIMNRFIMIVEKYLEITGDNDLLLDCCAVFEGHKFWSMIKMKLFPEYCKKASINYLGTGEDSHRLEALNVLFELNEPIAIDYLIDFLEKKIILSLLSVKYLNYNAIIDFENLEKLFKLIFDDEGFDDFESSRYREFVMNYVSNISNSKEGFENVMLMLDKRKKEVEENDKDLFYINLLIDKCPNSYINSKPYTFKDAFTESEKLLAS